MTTPAPIRKLLRRCLEKDRRKRLADAADARLEIEDALTTPAADASSSGVGAAAPSSVRSSRLAWLAFAVALLGMLALAIPTVRHLRETPPPPSPETRTEISTPATDQPGMFALSPDGRQIVFVASGDGASRLWVRSLGATTAQPVAGTDGATFPFWSPDSRSVGFFAGNVLKRLDLGGGAPQTLAPVTTGRGGTWNAEGVILFASSATGPLSRIAAAGGTAVPATTLDQQTGHRWPVFLPDGRRFLFYATGGAHTSGIFLGALDATPPTRLTAADAAGTYFPGGPGRAEASREGGWLLWVRGGTLVAQRLELARSALAGDPVPVADSVAIDGSIYRSAVSVSATGLVAYRFGAALRRQLVWRDRTGKVLGTLGAPDDINLLDPSVAPDGRRVAVSRVVQGNIDLWLLDGARTSRFTFGRSQDRLPIWSPDGIRVVFQSFRTGTGNLYVKEASGAGTETLLVESNQPKQVTDWSADGRFVVYQSLDPQTGTDIWVRPMMGDEKPWSF